MKTLVIHPADPTTDMLKIIYEGKGWTVINSIGKKKDLKETIKSHDRIIMLGHGTGYGLIGGTDGYAIDSSFVYLLKEKYCVCIWCNADVFVEKYELSGFYTGMIISEDIEALIYGVDAITSEVDFSNTLFSKSVADVIDVKGISGSAMVGLVTEQYVTDDDNDIIKFNRKNIYHT